MGRRGNGEGSIYRAPDGRWRGAIDLGWVDGKRKRRLVSGKTRNEVAAKLREAQKAADQGVETDARMTVGKWLDHWLETVVDGRVGSDNTRANYRHVVKRHIEPKLGRVLLAKLTAEQVDKFLALKADEGHSLSHVARMRSILADALRHAERRGLVVRNAGALAVMPKMDAPAERRAFTPDECRKLIAAAAGERLEAMVVVGLTCGLRPGELAGLIWTDLDLDGTPPTLTVSGSLKLNTLDGSKARGAVKRSTAGHRTIALPPVAVEALKAHSARHKREQLKAGPLWDSAGLVFTTEAGQPLNPSTVRTMFARVGKRAGVEGANFPYLMRHTVVSNLLDNGATIEEVADLTGDDCRTLYKHYRHKVRPVADAATRMQLLLTTAAPAEDAG